MTALGDSARRKNLVLEGGSSRVLRKALAAGLVRRSAPSIKNTRKRAIEGFEYAALMMDRTASTPMSFSPAATSTKSG
jgi:hypothetical protein